MRNRNPIPGYRENRENSKFPVEDHRDNVLYERLPARGESVAILSWDLFRGSEYKDVVRGLTTALMMPIRSAAEQNPNAACVAAYRFVAEQTAHLNADFGLVTGESLVDSLSEPTYQHLFVSALASLDSEGVGGMGVSFVFALWQHQVCWDVFRYVEEFYRSRQKKLVPSGYCDAAALLEKKLATVLRVNVENTWLFLMLTFPHAFGRERGAVVMWQVAGMLRARLLSMPGFRRLPAAVITDAVEDVSGLALNGMASEELWMKSRGNIATFLRTLPLRFTEKITYEVQEIAPRWEELSESLLSSTGVVDSGFEVVDGCASVTDRLKVVLPLLTSTQRIVAEDFLRYFESMDREPTHQQQADRLGMNRLSVAKQWSRMRERLNKLGVDF